MIDIESMEKAKRISHLVRTIEAAENELKQVMGIEDEIDEEDIERDQPFGKVYSIPVHVKKPGKVKKEKVTKSGRKRSACGKCGEVGHNSKTCGASRPAKKSPLLKEKDEDYDEGDLMLNIDTTPLTRAQFQDIKVASNHGMTSKAICEEMGISLKDTNWAISSVDYSAYIDLREKNT